MTHSFCSSDPLEAEQSANLTARRHLSRPPPALARRRGSFLHPTPGIPGQHATRYGGLAIRTSVRLHSAARETASSRAAACLRSNVCPAVHDQTSTALGAVLARIAAGGTSSDEALIRVLDSQTRPVDPPLRLGRYRGGFPCRWRQIPAPLRRVSASADGSAAVCGGLRSMRRLWAL